MTGDLDEDEEGVEGDDRTMAAEELVIDFEMNHEHEMVITRAAGISRSELEEIEICMLQGKQRMPRLLRMEWSELDGEVTFRYPLSGRRLLAHRLQTQPIGMRDFYAMLLVVAETLDDCKDYMLRPEGFLLDERALFIGERLEELYLCYVPIAQTGASAGTNKAAQALVSLAVKWLGHVAHPDGEGMKRVFRHLRSGHVSWRELRHTLMALIHESLAASEHGLSATERPNAARKLSVDGSAGEGIRCSFEPPYVEGRLLAGHAAEVKPVEELGRAARPGSLSLGNDQPVIPGPILSDDAAEVDKPKPNAGLLYGAGFVVAAAVIWRYVYLPTGTNRSLLIASGLTLVAAAAVLFLWRKHNMDPAAEKEWDHQGRLDEAGDEAEVHYPPGAYEQVPGDGCDDAGERAARRWFGSANSYQAAYPRMDAQAPGWDPKASSPGFSGVSHVQAGVVMAAVGHRAVNSVEMPHPSHDEATVLLGGTGRNGADKGGAPAVRQLLAREAAGESRVLDIGSTFMIGRAAEGVDYTDPAPGISRTHLEIQTADDRWTARDVGSRNGSTLNGETMVPYKSYPLHIGDVLQLAGENGPKYVVRAG